MAMTLACQDLGTDCSYVAHAKTEEELMANMGKHAKSVHGFTDEQLKDPEMMKKAQAAIKKE